MSAALDTSPAVKKPQAIPPEYTVLTEWVSGEYFNGKPNWSETATTQLVKLSSLKPHPFNSRLIEGSEKLAKLFTSVKDHGLEEPLLICQEETKKPDGASKIENAQEAEVGLILSGHRRIQACYELAHKLGLDPEYCLVPINIHAKVKIPIEEQLQIVLRMNLRQDRANPLEEATMLEEAFKSRSLKTEQDAVDQFGYDLKEVRELRKLLTLPLEVQERIYNEEFGKGIALALTEYDCKGDESSICRFAAAIAETSGITLAEVKQMIKDHNGLDERAGKKPLRVNKASSAQMQGAGEILVKDKGIASLLQKPSAQKPEQQKDLVSTTPTDKITPPVVHETPKRTNNAALSLTSLDKYECEKDRELINFFSQSLVSLEDLTALNITPTDSRFEQVLAQHAALQNGSLKHPDLIDLASVVNGWRVWVDESLNNSEIKIGSPLSLLLEVTKDEDRFVLALNSLGPTFLITPQAFQICGIKEEKALISSLVRWAEEQKIAGKKFSGRIEESDELRIDIGDLARYFLESLRKSVVLASATAHGRVNPKVLTNANIPFVSELKPDSDGLVSLSTGSLMISNTIRRIASLIAKWPTLHQETQEAFAFGVKE